MFTEIIHNWNLVFHLSLYYHTDHHWTTLGAYYAYLQAAAVMGIDTSSDSYDKAPVSQTFKGTLSAKSGFRSSETDEIDVFSGAPYESDFLILTKGIIKKVPKRSAKKYVDYSNSFAELK